MLLEGLNTEIPFDVREHEQAEAKNKIGLLAAGFVEDGDTIIMDSSYIMTTGNRKSFRSFFHIPSSFLGKITIATNDR